MSESKIQIKVGSVEFVAEGDPAWITKEVDKFIKEVPGLSKISPPSGGNLGGGGGHAPMGTDAVIASKPLATFLKERDATVTQVKKFLVTAVWLEAKGKGRLTTSNVTEALSAANQSRLGNAADCLNQNVGKGFCEKEGTQFYVTQEGRDSLGK